VLNNTCLLHCCYTVFELLLHCSYTIVTLLLHCCYTVVTLLLHCCYTVLTLLLHCCYTVVTLLLHCCYTVVTSLSTLISWRTPFRVSRVGRVRCSVVICVQYRERKRAKMEQRIQGRKQRVIKRHIEQKSHTKEAILFLSKN
jgi:hypothetical protein